MVEQTLQAFYQGKGVSGSTACSEASRRQSQAGLLLLSLWAWPYQHLLYPLWRGIGILLAACPTLPTHTMGHCRRQAAPKHHLPCLPAALPHTPAHTPVPSGLSPSSGHGVACIKISHCHHLLGGRTRLTRHAPSLNSALRQEDRTGTAACIPATACRSPGNRTTETGWLASPGLVTWPGASGFQTRADLAQEGAGGGPSLSMEGGNLWASETRQAGRGRAGAQGGEGTKISPPRLIQPPPS